METLLQTYSFEIEVRTSDCMTDCAPSVKVGSSRCRSLMMELGSADLVFLCFVCFWRE